MAMQPTITGLDEYEKLDILLKALLREPEGKLLFVAFHQQVPQLDAAEIPPLLERLIRDGVFAREEGPKGYEIKVTEAGIDFYLSGGYTRDWSEWPESISPEPGRHRRRLARLCLSAGLLILLAILFYIFRK